MFSYFTRFYRTVGFDIIALIFFDITNKIRLLEKQNAGQSSL